MPVDYSKWDNLELSDDSDIEVHPNVDKRSFIRAKQSQIHQERQHRRHQIETLKYEKQVNDGLAARIGSLLSSLRGHRDEVASGSASAGEVAFRAVMADAARRRPEDDRPPKPPADVHANVDQTDTTYTQMMAALLDQVNKALDEQKPKAAEGAARYDAMLAEIEAHASKVDDLQRQLLAKLGELEQEEARKITSDGIHTGFDSSHVNKSAPAAGANTSGSGSGSGSGKPELLNPGYQGAGEPVAASSASSSSSPSKADTAADNDDPSEPTPLARKFAAIAPNNHYDSRAFIVANPQVLAERHEEGVLMLAFDAEMDGDQDTARRCVHQAKLLEYCRSLGRDGVAMFFKRIETRDHKAHDLFYGDVQDTYVKIMTRVKEIKAQQAAGGGGSAVEGGVEQIQLHAVEPGTVINISVPPADSQDPDVVQARKIFEGFAPEMRKALESGSLDAVNEVLGRMKVDEAEALVGDFGEAGILSLEDDIIDATTEEGRAQLKDMGRQDFVDERGVAVDAPPAEAGKKEEYGDPE
ncbi:hsp90 co-chaperone Cdc37 [Sporothrix curviconia]|uniref:Hsp90 chaperone protein kinase-targeting subunit n=1 Tax=Sporothrix curviconia TaxID=1260050 RepID=A0ABP0C5L8_9PEZI